MAEGSDDAYDYDLVVLGGGSGGVRASRIAASHGARTLLVEGQVRLIQFDSIPKASHDGAFIFHGVSRHVASWRMAPQAIARSEARASTSAASQRS